MRNTSTVPSYSFDKETGWRLDLPMSIVPGTRVLCLYRVSTTKQLYHDMNDEADIPMQRLRCREFAQQNGWTIVCELQEEGISGHKVRAENRDKIQMIKDYAVKQKFDILLVFMFDRIGRIADETPFVVEWLISHGIRVWASQEGEQRIDNHTDRLMNYIRFWQADGESQKTSIRTANSMHILTEQGYFTGGTRPYGYDLVKSGRMNKKKQEVHDLAINEDEAAQIRLMFHLAYTYGYGAQSIVNHMNANGYKNRSMLEVRSRRYQQTRSAPLNTRGSSLLAGNIFCGHCGARLCITTSGKGRRRADGTDVVRTRYCCQTKTRTHGECGGQTGYTVRKVDEIIDTFVRSVLEKVRAVDRTEIVQAQNRIDIESKKQHIRELRRDAEKAESELQKLQSEIIRSLTGESAFTPQMLRPAIDAQERKFADLMQTLRAAEEDMHDSENNLLALTERFDDVLHWAAMYNNADMAAKKMIVSRIIERVDMFRDYEIRITLNISIEQFLNTIEIVA